jgi:septal ring factor EnvC (AmiA/AmiB activator)
MEPDRVKPAPASAAEVFDAVRSGGGLDRHTTPPPGQPAEEGIEDTDQPTPVSGDRTGRRLVAALIAGLLVLAALVVLGAVAHGDLEHTAGTLAVERTRLAQSQSQLSAARHRLAAVQSQSDTAGRALSAASTRLATAQSQLARAQADVSTQGVSISNLDTCLAGVEKALNQIALADQPGAVATLQSVASNCRAAEPTST